MVLKEIPIQEEYEKGNVSPQDVEKLRQWLKTQPHLPEKHITDLDIILAYHSSNRSIEVAKQLMDLNYSLRTLFMAYFQERSFDTTIKRTFRNTLFVPLPVRTKDGCVVMYCHCVNGDPNEFDVAHSIKAFLMSIDVLQYETGTWPGLEVVINFDGYTTGHMAKIDLRNVQQILYYLQEAIPLKLKKLHLLNAPSYFDRLMTIMKPFVKNEMISLLEFYTDGFKNIGKLLPLEAFPKDVGGNYKTVAELNEEVFKKLETAQTFFAEENKKRVVESLRPGKVKSYADIFGGVEGSFKKLEID
ncbi:unnamed protein product [Pieris brassicae]|uniref:CRAL-TRIO domain-containing protein n=1 Tax=Pieris brassicae TaxID=7116 RepID=A0A9P0TB57_PIEBR|nr:unnamed protein product [Pieris brassicae]